MKNIIIIVITTLLSLSCSNINKTIKVAYVQKCSPSKMDSLHIDVAKAINKEGYDLIFFEKLELTVVNEIINSLPEYEFYLGKTENGKKIREVQPIAYKKEHFTIQTQAYLELGYPASPAQEGSPGHVVAAKLRENSSGRTIFALNASTTKSHINEQIYNIHKIIKSYTDNLPTILAGDFTENDDQFKLITGHWENMVKLDGVSTFSSLNKDSKSDIHHVFVNGFLNIDRNRRGKRTKNIKVSNYTISFNKNFKDVRTQSQPYPMTKPLPYFEQKQIVFNHSLAIKVTNPNTEAYVVYSTDESEPSLHSPVYHHPITIHESCRVKMRSIQKGSEFGGLVCRYFIKTDKKNYHVSEIASNTPKAGNSKAGLQYLTDYQKGDESRTHESWLPIEPNQTLAITIKMDEPTDLNHIYLSFSTPGKIILPEIEMAAMGGENQLLVHNDLQTSLLGGALSQCGTEGWIKLNTPIKTQELVLNLKLGQNSTIPIYIDEIVLQ